MKATTTYTTTLHGQGRILVQWRDGRRRQRTIAYDHSAPDPHAAALHGVFGGNAVLRESDREDAAWPTRRLWTVTTINRESSDA